MSPRFVRESFSPPRSEPITSRNARNFCSVPLKIFPLSLSFLFSTTPNGKEAEIKGAATGAAATGAGGERGLLPNVRLRQNGRRKCDYGGRGDQDGVGRVVEKK